MDTAMPTTMTQSEADVRSLLFQDRMHSMLSEAATAVLVSIGHRRGLFALLAEMGSATAEDLSTSCGLGERQLTSWLDCMSSAGIVSRDGESGRYSIPGYGIDALLGSATGSSAAALSQYIGLFGNVEGLVSDSMAHRCGVHPREYQRQLEIEDGIEQEAACVALEEVLSLAPGMKRKLEIGAMVLQPDCGSGQLLAHLARRYPRSRFIGYDRNPAAIRMARKLQLRNNAHNLSFDETGNPPEGSGNRFDLVIVNCGLRNQADAGTYLGQLHALLTSDGVLLLRELRRPAEGQQDRLAAFMHAYESMVGIPQAIATGQPEANAQPHLDGMGIQLIRAGFTPGSLSGSDSDVLADWLFTSKVNMAPRLIDPDRYEFGAFIGRLSN